MKDALNKLLIIIVLAATIVLSSCSSPQSTGKTFIGGTEALKTEFMAGNPPDTTTDGGTGGFSIVVKMTNVGESSVKAEDGLIQIWGLDSGIYNSNIPEFKKYFRDQTGFGPEIRGAVKNFDGTVLNGGIATIEFPDLKYVPTIQGDLQQKIWANICYKYTTKVAAQVCVKSDVEKAFSDKDICAVEGEKTPQNSGAPVQITSLKESFAGNGKIGLTATITHVGAGDNFFKDDRLECNDVESNNDRGKVWIGFKNLQVAGKSIPVDCGSMNDKSTRDDFVGGYVRLFADGTGKETTTIYCTIDIGTTSNIVEVPLEAKLGYAYLQHIEKDITIRHISK
jgi:hypothetical protein